MTSTRLVIAGVGGHGRELDDIARSCGVASLGFLDDAAPVGSHDYGQVVGTTREPPTGATHFMVGIGLPSVRAEVAARLISLGLTPHEPLVHPGASVGARVSLGLGSVVGPGSVITVDVTIGEHVHLHGNVVVAHDCSLEEFATLTPRVALAGDVDVGARAFLGVGSTVNRAVTIGADTVIGAGSVVISDVADGETVAGVPARPLD